MGRTGRFPVTTNGTASQRFMVLARPLVLLLALTVTASPWGSAACAQRTGSARSGQTAKSAKAALEARGQPAAEESPAAVRLGDAKRQRLRIGVEIAAQGSPCGGILATLPLPTNWAEQLVSVIEEEVSNNVGDVGYRMLEDNVQQMVVWIPELAAGETARVMLLLEIDRHTQLEPLDTSSLHAPDRGARELRQYLGASPYIETRHARIRQAAREVRRDELNAWQQVEVIYDYVREKVAYREGDIKGAAQALKDGFGDCEELTSLFVALCRINGIPARMVWVTDHSYPEFYLEDDEGRGHWFPCQVAGTRAFGSMPDPRPILQKGDNIYVPEKKSRQRYVAEYLRVDSLRGNPPQVRFVRQFAAVDQP